MNKCPNCGENASHFVPPSLGEEGFFICLKKQGRNMKQYTDLGLLDDEIIDKVHDECAYQIEKWGVQTCSAFEWLTYTAEELGELAQAISEHEYRRASKEKVVEEAIQVATLALKIAEMFENAGEEK